MNSFEQAVFTAVDEHIKALLQEYDNKRIAPLVERIEALEKEQQANEDV